MKISPIIPVISTNYRKYNNTYSTNSIIFGNNYKHDYVDLDVYCINTDKDFHKKMKALKEKYLDDKRTFSDFLVSSMNVYNEHAIHYPIKEDFFEIKIKKRFIEFISKYINMEIHDKLDDYLQSNYYWGLFSNSKYGSSYSFEVAAQCVAPYAKNYEENLRLLKIKDMQEKETKLRAQLKEQERERKSKEFINETYFQPLITLKNDPTISLPNAIMIEGKNPKDNEELIGWALSKTPSSKIVVENDKSSNNTLIKNRLKSALEKSRQTFEDYRIPTLIYCEEFDRLVQSSNPPVEIASMKALLSNTYSKYGATIIFATQNSNKIDNVIRQPHRMKSINIDN